MTTDTDIDLKAGRRRVARSRGALSGVLLVVFGAWAALVPFIGPYFNFGFNPKPNDAWHWTSGRGWFEVLPGAVAVVGGLLLLLSSSRLMTLVGGWLGAIAGIWLVVGPPLSNVLKAGSLGGPDGSLRPGLRALEELLYFFGIGAAILLVAGVALGRLSIHSVRDVRAAERRAELQAAEEHRLAEERRTASEEALAEERRVDERRRVDAANASAGHPRETGEPGGARENELRDGAPGAPPNGEYPSRGSEQPRQGAAGSESYLGQHAGAGASPAPQQNPPPHGQPAQYAAPAEPQGPPVPRQEQPGIDPRQAPPPPPRA
ncbi:MAG: hypothetical protein ACR2LX_00150 [Jatrophihabitans sp.]